MDKQKKINPILTTREVEDHFEITAATRIRWTKQGLLKSYKVSGRVYYKAKEIEEALMPVTKLIE